MAFLTSDDYTVQLRTEISRIIDPTAEKTKLKKAEDMAISQIKNYLSNRFDLDLIFVNAPGESETDTRDAFIVMLTIDMALYHLWSKEGGNSIPKTRQDRYDDCLDWLKAVQKGAACNLPLLKDENEELISNVRISSRRELEDNQY